jgi:hypothetical protein
MNRDLKDGTRDPEILSTKKFKFFTKFRTACLDELGLFNVFIKSFSDQCINVLLFLQEHFKDFRNIKSY